MLAFDLDSGTTVSRDVTATLPHTDWPLDAHFSDGTVMSVTEDHRFWSVRIGIVDRGPLALADAPSVHHERADV